MNTGRPLTIALLGLVALVTGCTAGGEEKSASQSSAVSGVCAATPLSPADPYEAGLLAFGCGGEHAYKESWEHGWFTTCPSVTDVRKVQCGPNGGYAELNLSEYIACWSSDTSYVGQTWDGCILPLGYVAQSIPVGPTCSGACWVDPEW